MNLAASFSPLEEQIENSVFEYKQHKWVYLDHSETAAKPTP